MLVDDGLPAEQQRIQHARDSSDKRTRGRRIAGKREDKDRHDDVLRRDQRGLAIRAKREVLARVVREGDEQACGLEGVGGEGYACRGARGDEFEDLGNFDDGAEGDDGNS